MFPRKPHRRVLSLSLARNLRVGCHYPRNGRGMMMAPPGVRQRGRNNRIAMRRWSSRMTTMNPPLLPISSDRRSYGSCSGGASPPFVASATLVPTTPRVRYRRPRSVQVATSKAPNAAGQPVKVVQISTRDSWPQWPRKIWMGLLWRRVGSCPSNMLNLPTSHDFPGVESFHHLHFENTMTGGLQEEGYIHGFDVSSNGRSGPAFTGPCLPRESRRSAHQEERALSCQRDRTIKNQLKSLSRSFPLRTSCTNRKKCR